MTKPQPSRLSWKTAHRKNRTTSSSVESKHNNACQQLNPYKPSSTLRGSQNSIQDGNFERNPRRERRLSLSANSRGDSNKVVENSFDDDDCLDDDLDNILSNIEGDSDEDKLPVAAAMPTDTEDVATGSNNLQQSSCEHEDAMANKKKQRPLMLKVKPVNFENSDTIYNARINGVHDSEPLHQIAIDMSTVDDSTNPFWCNQNSSEVDNPINDLPRKRPDTTIDPHPIRRKSIVDEIMDDGLFSQTGPIEKPASPHHNNTKKLEPIECMPQIVLSNNTNGSTNVHNNVTNIFGEINHHNQADDTISTVTDQTDTPFIYTYKKSTLDDDSVSQITSSLAPSLGSSVLKNISQETREGTAATNRFKTATWMGSGVNRTKPTRHGAVAAGTFGRDRKNRRLRGHINSTCSSSDAANSRYEERKSSLDEFSNAINSFEMQMPQSRVIQEFDLCTIDSEKSGVSRRRSNNDSNSYVSTLGNGGVSVAGQSTTNGSVSRGSSSKSGGLVAMLAKKAERFFLPASLKITQRKKFDRSDSSDSLEDLLLEEGAKTLLRRGPSNDTNDDDIDYFSRAMSTSSYGSGSRSRGTSHGTRSASAKQFRLCSVISLIAIIYLILLTRDGDNTEERVEYAKPEFGPVNNPNMWRKRNTGELQPDQYTDLNLSTDTKKVPPRHSKEHVHLPLALENAANVDVGPFQKSIDVPFYWHIPRSAGVTVSDILGSCLKLVLASDAGSSLAFSKEQTLRVVQSPRQITFVNIDTYTPKGIQRAKQLGLVTSGMADVILSPLLHDTAALFTPTRNARIFTMIRDPIERSASLFYFIQDTQWKRPETRNDQLADMPIENFYEQGLAENNWMTRFLTNQLSKPKLTTQDAELAKEILREKFLIGLVEKKVQSFERFQKYFGWIPSDYECIQNKLEWSWLMKHKYVSVEKGTEAWDLISSQNTFDMLVYEYAKELFDHQESLMR